MARPVVQATLMRQICNFVDLHLTEPDFSSGQMRHDHFLTAVGQVAKGGIAILDDAMHELHQKEMNRTCAHYRYDLFSIPWTQDWYGRYAALVVRP